MSFVPGKLLSLALTPSHIALALILAGLIFLTRGVRLRLGLRLAWFGLGYLVIAGFSPLGNILILPLERAAETAPRPQPGDKIYGIILLGGFEDGWVTSGRQTLTLNESSERLTEGVRLARQFPDSKVVFTGGSGALWKRGQDATGPVSAYLTDAGIAPSRIVLEGSSRNTSENATLSAQILKPEPSQTWILVTSAYHMARAVGLFRNAGFEIQPYPVDFRTRDAGDSIRFFDRFADGLKRTDFATAEWLSLFASRLTGKIDTLFPELKPISLKSQATAKFDQVLEGLHSR